MFIQFLAFPPLARHFGVLNCFKLVTLTFPPIYVLTPFTALLPTPGLQQIFVFVIMFFKCWSAIFAFPCTIILLTNSAKSLMVLGTLNGVATSTSAMGRAVGPGVAGWMFTVGVSRGWVILPWWVLALFAAAGAVPVWWIVEMDGPGTSSGRDSSDGEDETSPLLNERSRIERYS